MGKSGADEFGTRANPAWGSERLCYRSLPMARRSRSRYLWLAAWVGSLGACRGSAVDADAADGGIELHACRLPGVREAECGTVEVFEDRAAAAGRRISLRVAVIPAVARFPEPDPLFVLVGGPGQAATEVAPVMVGALDRIHRERDIVLVDQRGTGSSNPLDCEPEDESAASEMRELFRVDLPMDRLTACRRGYDADLAAYTTPVAMDDLDEVRARLGYEQINLWGGSYGTRAALVYLRRHEAHVRSVILDGVAPVSMKLPLFMARDGQRALDLALDACEADAPCRKQFPRLRSTLEELLRGLEQSPARVELEHPRTGEPTRVEIERDAVTGILRGALYTPETAALVPTVIQRAHAGDFQPLAALALTGASVSESLSLGMFLSVVCSEDIPQVTDAERESAALGTSFGPGMYDAVAAACADWPRATVPAGYGEPVQSDVPVLVFSGELDPATPPSWGEDVARHLARSKHVIVPGVGHGTWHRGCVPELMADFIDRASVDGIDPACTQHLHRPPFFVSYAGPPP